jgi:UDP-glucuronate 4-epimerase
VNILVTGGAGFIGFHVSKALLERGDSVVIVDNFNDYYDPKLKYARVNQIKKYKKLVIIKVDISDYKAMEKVFKKYRFDKICHLAAQAGVRYSLENPFQYETSNNLGMLTILELARIYKVKDIIYASSSSVYGGNKKIPFSEKDNVDSPVSFYAATKKSNELYAHVYHHLYGINCTGLRFFTVYGPWGRPDMALFKFVKNILVDKPIEVYNNGNMKRDFTYISDIVKGVISAIDKPFPYEIFNLGNNKPINLSKFIELIELNLNKKAKKEFLPNKKEEVKITYSDIDKARRMLNYSPNVDIEEGVYNFIKWYKSFNKK